MDQPPNTSLPEINVSSKDDWDFLSKPAAVNEEDKKEQQPPKDTHQQATSDSESKTTGLTRALSLPRQLNKSTDEESIRTEIINIPTTNPSHLFWVPASQHPEIAPAEFEKYVDTHGLIVRKKSTKRRQSVLSVYFTASDQQKLMEECDTAEAEKDRHAALDALESQAHTQKDTKEGKDEEAEDTKKRKMILRRSVSLHLPTTGDYARNVPDLLVFDRNSSPLDESRALVPKGDRPLLRRGARTNFKRNSSVNGPQRNRKSESDCMDSSERLEKSSIVRSTSAEGVILSDTLNGKEGSAVLEPESLALLSPVVENEEVRDLSIATKDKKKGSSSSSLSPPAPVVLARSVSTSTPSSNQGRKSAWSWAFWSDEKSSKKNNKIEPNASASTATLNTTTSSTPLLADEKSNDSTIPPTTNTTTTTAATATTTSIAKRFTLSSLFSRKSKSNHNNGSYTSTFDFLSDDPKKAPKDFQLNRMLMTRLPLHVERNIYKMSHVKLANPRRPLHEQVLISNQMFWYLSVIATNAPHSAPYDMPIEEQPKKKIPRKRLVKKQRPPPPPPSPPQQPQNNHQQQSSKKRSNNVNASNQKGNTTMFMSNPRPAESTGFVVPENYLNPKQRKQQEKQQIKMKPTMGNNKKTQMYHKKQQGSDSSSSDDDDDDDEVDENSDEEQGNITEKIAISHKEKEDEVPLAIYKANAFKKRIK
ncbi:hypothetical protein [Parasitella parasitica]|uniref:Protein Zds1 C-terminal domain-containing protein n=1 Tax=Parasitella parasitica TaxID=35722 RepID=A0A0B7MQS0_9FUNG|nr:hypothetical protein [Parasitella parasitica]